MFIDAFVVYIFLPSWVVLASFFMKLLLAVKRRKEVYFTMSWTCSDEYLILDKFTEYFISFREQTPFKLCDHSFLSIREDSADYKDFNGVVGNETDESAVFRNFSFYFNQLDPLLSHGTLYSSHPLVYVSLISGAHVSNRLLSFKYTKIPLFSMSKLFVTLSQKLNRKSINVE